MRESVELTKLFRETELCGLKKRNENKIKQKKPQSTTAGCTADCSRKSISLKQDKHIFSACISSREQAGADVNHAESPPRLRFPACLQPCGPAGDGASGRRTPSTPGTGGSPGQSADTDARFGLFFLMAKSETEKGREDPPECHPSVSDDL